MERGIVGSNKGVRCFFLNNRRRRFSQRKFTDLKEKMLSRMIFLSVSLFIRKFLTGSQLQLLFILRVARLFSQVRRCNLGQTFLREPVISERAWPGNHQFQRPMTCMPAGTRIVRIMLASTNTAR